MKVNMALLDDGQDEEKQKVQDEEPVTKAPPPEQDEDDDGDDDGEDQSDKHSKLKTVLLVALMLGGFAIFVSNMTGLVNNMRLDNQGTPSIVYEAQDRLDSFLDIGDDGSVTINVEDHQESEVPTDAVRDGPEDEADTEAPSQADESDESVSYADESAAIRAMQKKVDEANNNAAMEALKRQNAEDFLDSALQENEELQQKINQLTGGN